MSIKIENSVKTIFYSRIMDFVTFSFLLFIGIILFDSPYLAVNKFVVLLCAFLLIVILIILYKYIYKISSFISKITDIIIPDIDKILGIKRTTIINKVNSISDAFENFKASRLKLLNWCISCSIGMLTLLLYFVLLGQLQPELPKQNMLLCLSSGVLSGSIPLGFIGLGNIEGGWSGGLLLSGIKLEQALSTALSLHFFQVLFYTILGLIGYGGVKLIVKK
jgi:uncharacterized membrane protein YbhN (UPF0104 family)